MVPDWKADLSNTSVANKGQSIIQRRSLIIPDILSTFERLIEDSPNDSVVSLGKSI